MWKILDNFVESLDVLYYFLACICASYQAISFVINNRKLDKIKAYLDQNVRKNYNVDCYRIYENFSMRMSNFISLLLSSTVFFTGSSLIRTLYRVYVMKKDLHDNYLIPIVCSLPFEVTNWTRYSIAFVWTFTSLYTLVISKMITTTVQFTLCFYAVAIMVNLQKLANGLSDVK